MSITPVQCRAARAGLGWSEEELATRSATAAMDVVAFEREGGEQHGIARAIRRAFEKAGVTFSGEGCLCFDQAVHRGAAFIPPDKLTAENDD